MNDPLAKTLDEILRVAKNSGLQIFCGWLPEERSVLTVHWNQDNGGDWKNFLICARTANASILYLNWSPFEQFQVDEAVSRPESEIADSEERTKEKERLLSRIREFGDKVGLTCVIDMAFVANGVVHICEETADWFEEFLGLLPEEDEYEVKERRPADKATVNKWATALASDPKYIASKQRDYLLEKLAGDEFQKLPVFQILRRAETIFESDFRQAAEEKLAGEIRQLREQGLNLNAIAVRLGISRDRVSGLLSAIPNKR